MTKANLTSLYSLRAALSCLSFVCFFGSFAQQKKVIELPKDTVPFFRGAAVGGDVVGLAQLMFGDYGQYEAFLRFNIKDKYFPILEFGYGKAYSENPTSRLSYAAKAPYGRIGADFNVMKNKHDIYRIYVGGRYAFTSFKYDISSPDVTDPIWGHNAPYGAAGLSAYYHWIEGVFGIDAKIWGPLRLGWSVRYRRRIVHKGSNVGAPWYVPGFGRSGNSRLGGTFNVIIEI